MNIENENTFLAALQNGFNLFVGSGFSTLARDSSGQSLPVGSELGAELASRFDLPATLGLPQLATVINASRKDELREYLTMRFTVGSFDERYRIIEQMPVKYLFTTNIDNLLHEIYKNGQSAYLNDLDIRGAVFADRDAVNLITLHGCILDDERPFRFDPAELAAAVATEPDRWHYLRQALDAGPTIFCGYSLQDAGTLQSLYASSTGSGQNADKWITVLPGTETGLIEYFRAMRFQIIEGDISALLDYFNERYQGTTKLSLAQPTHELFPEWAIPDVGLVPVRPISEFLRGAPPSWYDVYSDQLVATSHNAAIRDALNSGKHTFIVGIPGSGKTTLMMQVLKDFQFAGHKLFCDAPTPEKAQLIVNRLSGVAGLIGLDNFADDLDGFDVLNSNANVQILACDEIYWFETVAHRLPINDIVVIDVTDLSETDIQNVVQNIPADIRQNMNQAPIDAITPALSIFDVVEHNIYLATLGQRYRAVLRSIGRQDRELLDFLLVCAYVHSCRTPISIDMLLAFFREQGLNYDDVFGLRDKLRGLVVDYTGEMDDGEQNYYMPRSTLVSKAIIGQATSQQMRRVITRFHDQLSSFRIHRFDVFRRRAFDHNLMRRVFDNWQEGMEFYRTAYEKEQNAYTLQQGALYLASKRRFQEAFRMIDEALSMSNRRNPSILNSHAAIMFNANINSPETDGSVEKTLHDSMEILRECYEYDRRKAYHARIFADQALQYDDRFGREKSEPYLERAHKWLAEERVNSPWHREVSRLLGAVKRRLG